MGHPDDLTALAHIALLPRTLRAVHEPDLGCDLLGRRWPSPILRRTRTPIADPDALSLVDAGNLSQPAPGVIPVLANERMGQLMPEVRRLAALALPALVLDLSPLALAPPFGTIPWHPRSREELAEIVAAAGRPLWLAGVASAEDAAAAAEAGVEAVIVDGSLGRTLAGPATAEILPEVVDAVAGVTRVYAAGEVGSGIDVLRLLALGAEAVVVGGDRSSAALTEELRYGMRLTGCASLRDVGYDIVFAPLFEDA
jgi:isopentenyl diphosphate isomerase/L-lactate dehydrogenase-like FMN-dependent dehydrogenase